MAFAIATYRRWSNPNYSPQFGVLIDNNGDGAPNFVISNYDQGLLSEGAFNAQTIALVQNLATGELNASFLAIADLDQSTMALPVLLSDIGVESTGRFSYTVQSLDLDDELRLVAADDTPIVPFNALAPAISADPAWMSIAGSDTVNVLVNRESLAASPSDGLLILEPNDDPGANQWEFVKVSVR